MKRVIPPKPKPRAESSKVGDVADVEAPKSSSKKIPINQSPSSAFATNRDYAAALPKHGLAGLINTVKYGDDYGRMKADFVDEMRYLSKLRHPCITTVMVSFGAVDIQIRTNHTFLTTHICSILISGSSHYQDRRADLGHGVYGVRESL